jgi:3-oxoadipate enol-lactonase
MREHVIDGMRYLEAGAGWPVVLIHAFPLSADMWRPQLARVPDGWRFIAPELSSLGSSRPPEGGGDEKQQNGGSHDGARESPWLPPSGGRITMDDYARGIARLLDRLEIDDAIIGGLSMGGYVTFALYRLAPERFTGMILADTRPGADSPDGRAARAKMRELLAAHGVAAIADQMLPKLLSPDADSDVISRVRRMIEAVPPQAIDAALAAMMERPDSTPDLPRMSCPTIVIVGEHDQVTPLAEAERMQAMLPRSRLTVIPGAGHLANVECPDEFADALHDFLVAPM